MNLFYKIAVLIALYGPFSQCSMIKLEQEKQNQHIVAQILQDLKPISEPTPDSTRDEARAAIQCHIKPTPSTHQHNNLVHPFSSPQSQIQINKTFLSPEYSISQQIKPLPLPTSSDEPQPKKSMRNVTQAIKTNPVQTPSKKTDSPANTIPKKSSNTYNSAPLLSEATTALSLPLQSFGTKIKNQIEEEEYTEITDKSAITKSYDSLYKMFNIKKGNLKALISVLHIQCLTGNAPGWIHVLNSGLIALYDLKKNEIKIVELDSKEDSSVKYSSEEHRSIVRSNKKTYPLLQNKISSLLQGNLYSNDQYSQLFERICNSIRIKINNNLCEKLNTTDINYYNSLEEVCRLFQIKSIETFLDGCRILYQHNGYNPVGLLSTGYSFGYLPIQHKLEIFLVDLREFKSNS